MTSGTAASAASLLKRLERRVREHGAEAAREKLDLLRGLARSALPNAREVHRLHEALCFLRAYPDDARVLNQVERMLGTFERRGDLLRHRKGLTNTGIAGTEIRFRFFAPTASWLARRWPERIAIDWEAFENQDRLETLLPLFAHYAESPALDEYAFSARQWMHRLKGPAETDAAFLVRRFERLRMDPFAREMLYDELDPPLILSPAAGTPSRTRAKLRAAPVAYPRRAFSRSRPVLRDEAEHRPRSIRALGLRQARRLIDMAREAMVTRERDLDVFSYASEQDVRLVDFGGGLQFACLGAIPERRLMLEAVTGYLTLKNGVPVGYVLSGALFESAEVAYNVFETFRGAEAATIFARVLAMLRHLFGARSFMVPPFQLGHGNEEGLASGAWWFYQKLGFRPVDRTALRLMRGELERMERDPSHRSSAATLEKLAREPVHFHLGAPRPDVMGRLPLPNVGLHVTRYLAGRFGAERERGARICSSEAAELLGLGSTAGLPPGERLSWERWSPLALILPGVERWPPSDRRAFAAVMRAKGGRRESDFVQAFDRHPRLRRAIARLAAREPRG